MPRTLTYSYDAPLAAEERKVEPPNEALTLQRAAGRFMDDTLLAPDLTLSFIAELSLNSEHGPTGGDTHEQASRIAYVIDDEGVVLRALSGLISSLGISARSFPSSKAFLTNIDSLIAGPIILDMKMVGADPQPLLEELNRRNISWPVIVIDGHGNVPLAVRSMKLGAANFLERPIDPLVLDVILADAFASVHQGTSARLENASARARFEALTKRQGEVIERLLDGLSNKQVAYELSVSPRTVEMHRAAAVKRLGVRTLSELSNLRRASTQAENGPATPP